MTVVKILIVISDGRVRRVVIVKRYWFNWLLKPEKEI
jgi:hypothetical protein